MAAMRNQGSTDRRGWESLDVPAHVEDTIQAIARFHAAHEAHASPLQRLIEWVTRGAGRPAFAASLTALIVGWIAFNLGLVEWPHARG